MNSSFINKSSELEQVLANFRSNEIKSILIFCAEKTAIELQKNYIPIINAHQFTFFGGVFPSLIYKSVPQEEGLILIGLHKTISYAVFSLADLEETLDAKIHAFKIAKKAQSPKSIFTLMSAFGDDKSVFLKSVFNNYGNQVNYFGGGCGDLSFTNSPCIVTNNGVFKNKGLIAEFDALFELNYTHGWKFYEKSFKVTQNHNNEIITIDWRPAIEVYIEAILALTGVHITPDNFPNHVKSYPFGILRLDSELIIRDPYAITERGGIKIVDKIEEGEYIRIMYGDSESLIKATGHLANKISTNDNTLTSFSFNCISRKLFHGSKINEELQQLSPNKLVGAFTVGEVVNEGKTYLEMCNKISATVTF